MAKDIKTEKQPNEMVELTVLRAVIHDGTRYNNGDTLKLPQSYADRLIALGVAEETE
jgi:hypothetical protein